MVKLEMELTDIDYDYLIREYLPRVQDRLQQSGSPLASLLGGSFAGNMLMMAPDSMKDRLAAELINLSASRLEEELEALAQRSGIPGKVQNLRAAAKSDE